MRLCTMPDCRFEEYFLPDTPETTFGDETLRNLLDVFTVHGQWHGIGGKRTDVGVYHAKISAEAGYPSLKVEQSKG